MEGVRDFWTLANLRREVCCGLVPHPHQARARSEAQTYRRNNPLAGNHARWPRIVQSARLCVWWCDGRGFGQTERQHHHHPKVGEPAIVDARRLQEQWPLCHHGQCNTYMGNIMAMIGRIVWRINMVGTAQANRTGTNIDCTKLMKGMYNSICWQHDV